VTFLSNNLKTRAVVAYPISFGIRPEFESINLTGHQDERPEKKNSLFSDFRLKKKKFLCSYDKSACTCTYHDNMTFGLKWKR
jgi:hypothetical protein